MEFGRVAETEINQVDFTLPPDPPFNKRVLTGKAAESPKMYIGCAKWGRSKWVGKLYPYGTKEKDFLQHYTRHYNSIELNITHYKIYGPAGIERWSKKANGKDFKFCPKLYKGITHKGKLSGKDFLTNEFFRGITAFKEHLGPVFIQVSESFGSKRIQELFDFLGKLPPAFSYFLEVRHPGWFTNKTSWEQLLTYLSVQKMGMVITDTSGRRDCAHLHLTVPSAFIRFVGNSLHPTDYKRIDDWVNRIKFWINNGLKEIYFFMHMHNEALSPELTVYLIDRINQACVMQLQKPGIIAGGAAC